jgi:hypothetical protein
LERQNKCIGKGFLSDPKLFRFSDFAADEQARIAVRRQVALSSGTTLECGAVHKFRERLQEAILLTPTTMSVRISERGGCQVWGE